MKKIFLSPLFFVVAPMVACSSTPEVKKDAIPLATVQDIAAAQDKAKAEQEKRAQEALDASPLYFEFDAHLLDRDAQRRLSKVAQQMKHKADTVVSIEGHCDDRGSNEYNLALGERRAQAARDYLVRVGIEESRIKIVSFGEELPAVDGTSNEARQQNRRDEFTFILTQDEMALSDAPPLEYSVTWDGVPPEDV